MSRPLPSGLTSDFDAQDLAVRLWLSDQQWMAVLSRLESQASPADRPEPDGDRRDPDRPRYPLHLRTMLRVLQPNGDRGTYLVALRNVSVGGLGFLSPEPLERGTRCTLALAPYPHGHSGGQIVAGRVVWHRPVDDLPFRAFEIGLQCEQPIDLGSILTDHDLPA